MQQPQQVSFSFKIPAFLSVILSLAYVRQVVTEIAQTAGVAAAVAGLTALAQQEPTIAAHYGLSPIVSAQLVAVVGAARAFVSGLNSAKQSDITDVTNLAADASNTALTANSTARAAINIVSADKQAGATVGAPVPPPPPAPAS